MATTTQGIAPGQYDSNAIHNSVVRNLKAFKEVEGKVNGPYTPLKSLPSKARKEILKDVGSVFDLDGSESKLVRDATNIKTNLKRIKRDKRKIAAVGGAEKIKILEQQAHILDAVGKAQLKFKKGGVSINDAFNGGPSKAIYEANVAMAKSNHPDGKTIALGNFKLLDELGYASLQEGKGKHGTFIGNLETEVNLQASDPDILPFVAASSAAKGFGGSQGGPGGLPPELAALAGKGKGRVAA